MKRANKLVVDFDGVLFHTRDFPNVGPQRLANKLVAAYVRHKHKKGWVVILNTMREPGRGLEEAVAACKAKGIPLDLVNENYQPDIDYWGGDSRKIGATRLIDDTQIGLVGWLLRVFG